MFRFVHTSSVIILILLFASISPAGADGGGGAPPHPSLSLGAAGPAAAIIPPITGTVFISTPLGGDCDQKGTWDSKTSTCTLTESVSETIQIDSDDITLDCDDNEVDDPAVAINIADGRSNIIIKNCMLRTSILGVNSFFSNNVIVKNNVISNTVFRGIQFVFSDEAKILNNKNHAQEIGSANFFCVECEHSHNTHVNNFISVLVFGGNGNTVTDNIMKSVGTSAGIVAEGYEDNVVSKNHITTNGEFAEAILFFGSSNNVVSDNTVRGISFGGIRFFDFSNNNLTENNVLDGPTRGVAVVNGSNNWVEGNRLTGTGVGIFNGINEDNRVANGNWITNNTIRNGQSNVIEELTHGVFLGGGGADPLIGNVGGNIISGNEIRNLQGDGIHLNFPLDLFSAGDNEIKRNTITGNALAGTAFEGLELDPTKIRFTENNVLRNLGLQVESSECVELSVDGVGNFWGRGACNSADSECFAPGDDSNSPCVVDSFPSSTRFLRR